MTNSTSVDEEQHSKPSSLCLVYVECTYRNRQHSQSHRLSVVYGNLHRMRTNSTTITITTITIAIVITTAILVCPSVLFTISNTI